MEMDCRLAKVIVTMVFFEIMEEGSTGYQESCPSTDCLSIVEDGYANGDGLYWIAPYDMEPFEVYCDMTTEGGGWILFSDLTQISGNFGSLPVYAGSFDSGEPGTAPYSLDLDKLHRGDGNTFDIMTWIGEEDVHKSDFSGLYETIYIFSRSK